MVYGIEKNEKPLDQKLPVEALCHAVFSAYDLKTKANSQPSLEKKMMCFVCNLQKSLSKIIVKKVLGNTEQRLIKNA